MYSVYADNQKLDIKFPFKFIDKKYVLNTIEWQSKNLLEITYREG